MLYDDKYDKTEERMLDVIDSVRDLSWDRFVASLYIRNCSPIDVDIRLAEVRRCLDTVHGETLRLAKLELTYNRDFAVKDNKRFTTAEKLFNRLRSSMACIRKRFHESCPIIKKQLPNPAFKPSIFERSVLTKGACARELYDITTFDDNVQALYYEQQALFANVILSLAICYRVIKEEKEIRSNPKLCVQRLEEQCQRILTQLEGALDFTTAIPESDIQKMIDLIGKEKFAQQNFHVSSIKDVRAYAIASAYRKDQENHQPQGTSIIFHDPEKAADALLLCQHFDELVYDNCKKLNALRIRLFCNWCAGGKVDNPKQAYYTFMLKYYKGTRTSFPGWHSITTSKKGKDIDAEQRKFNEEADALLLKLKDEAQNRLVSNI